jgi:glutamate/tyrosine decarboxylase-like PLP-dependent enzyme
MTNICRPPSDACGLSQLVPQLMSVVEKLHAEMATASVRGKLEPGEMRAYLEAEYQLDRPHPLVDLACDIFNRLYSGIVHPNHPRHFGLFVPGVRAAGVVADTIAAVLNPQLGAWWYAPAASEIESFVLDACSAKIGIDPAQGCAHFTTGGSEANATAVALALTRAFPGYAQNGMASSKQQPVLYVSEQAHHCFLKIAHQAGLGRSAVRRVKTDHALCMDVEDLRRQYRRDSSRGAKPFMVVGTAGTTAAGAFDPLLSLAEFSRETGIWFHVDAAWGGLALLLDETRFLLAGIEQADSVTWDAHKVFPVPMGAGMFFARNRANQAQTFAVHTGYLPPPTQGTVDLYGASIQWSRRFIGLKVFLTLAELGWAGIRSLLRQQLQAGETLREELLAAGFLLLNSSQLPLVCFTHETIRTGSRKAEDIVNQVVSSGRAWLSAVRLRPGDPNTMRACITNHNTTPGDVRTLVAELSRLLRERAHG